MKPFWKTLCLLGAVMLHNSHDLRAQCTNTLQSVTYDTLVAGTGNDTHVFSLPQMDPSAGTLVYAKINSRVSVNYGFTLQNVENVPRTFSVSVGRYDHFSSATLSTPFTDINTVPLGSYPLNPGNSVSRVPAPIMSQYLKSDSVTQNMAGFLGSGQVDFAYTPITYTNLTGSNTYYYSATASDTIRFSITYYYCNTFVLSAELKDFQATLDQPGSIRLDWTVLNEEPGRSYEIQQSTDGLHFQSWTVLSSAETLPHLADYSYRYALTGREGLQVYFRLKIMDRSGRESYSVIREISIPGESPAIRLYPNPASEAVNLSFNQGLPGNWELTLYSASGERVQQAYFNNSVSGRLVFAHKLAAGIYFIRAQELTSRKSYVLNFLAN